MSLVRQSDSQTQSESDTGPGDNESAQMHGGNEHSALGHRGDCAGANSAQRLAAAKWLGQHYGKEDVYERVPAGDKGELSYDMFEHDRRGVFTRLCSHIKETIRQLRLSLSNRLLLSLEGPEHVKSWRPRLMLVAFDDDDDTGAQRPTAAAVGGDGAAGELHTSYSPLLALAEQLMTGKGFAVATKFIKRGALESAAPSAGAGAAGSHLANSTMSVAAASPSVHAYTQFGDSADPCVGIESLEAAGPSTTVTATMAWAIRHKQTELEDELQQRAVHGCVQVIVYDSAKSLPLVTWAALQAVGLGALTPNTVLISFPQGDGDGSGNKWKTEPLVDFWYKIHRSIDLDMTLVIAKGDFPSGKQQMHGTIDIWWILHDGGVVLLLPFLLRKHRMWDGCHMRIFVAAEMHDDVERMQLALKNWLFELRIDASVKVVQFKNDVIRPYAEGRAEAVEERRRYQQTLSVEKGHSQHGTGSKRSKTTQSRATGEQAAALNKQLAGDPQNVADRYMGGKSAESVTAEGTLSGGDDDDDAPPQPQPSAEASAHTAAESDEHASHPDISDASTAYSLDATLDSLRLRQVHRATFFYSAAELNAAIVAHSSADAALVVLNIPRPPDDTAAMRPYLMYLDQVTQRLPRVLLIRGTGKQVVTSYN